MGEVCWDDRSVTEDTVGVVKVFKKTVASDALLGARVVREGLPSSVERHVTAGECGVDPSSYSFGGKDGSALVGENLCVLDCSR